MVRRTRKRNLMKKYIHLGIALLAVFGFGTAAWSQVPVHALAAASTMNAAITDGSNGADEPILTIKKRVDEVNVLFIATDRHGKFVRNLNQGDFSILDDHKPAQ